MIRQYLVLFSMLLVASTSFALDIDTARQQSSHRIFMLETALAPANPKAVVTTWANAAKNRNGAVQYMLMCPDLQKANLNNLDNLNWVTGVSSPWISSTKIVSQTQKQGTWKYVIQYKFSTGSGIAGSMVDHIDVVHVDAAVNSSQQFCISQFGYLSPVSKL